MVRVETGLILLVDVLDRLGTKVVGVSQVVADDALGQRSAAWSWQIAQMAVSAIMAEVPHGVGGR